MDINRSIEFVFEDKEWIPKVLIGGLVSLIPIVNLAVAGYSLRTAQNVAAGKEPALPEWDDLGDYIIKGLLIAVAGLIYAIPFLCIGLLLLPVSMVSNGGQPGVLGALGLMVVVCAAVLYGLFVAVWVPVAALNYAATSDFGAFFHFAEIWGLLERNLGDLLVVLLISIVVGIVAGIIGGFLCGIGALFTGFISQQIVWHLLGQILQKGGRLAPAPAG